MQGHRAPRGRARAGTQLHHRGGPGRPVPPSGFFPLQEGLEASTPMVSGGWVLRRLVSQQALNPPCPPPFVGDVSSAPLGAEAASGPAPRPGSGCAVGTGEEEGGPEGAGRVPVRPRRTGWSQTMPKVGSSAMAGVREQTTVCGVGTGLRRGEG